MGAVLLVGGHSGPHGLAPQELPIGIVTSLVGAPFLFVLIRRLHAAAA